MRNKVVIENILERLEAKIKKVGYYIRRDEPETAFTGIEPILEDVSSIRTLLNREEQDQ